jgi:lipoprotein-releasing system permease protein
VNLPFFIARRYLLHQKGAFSAFIIRLAIVATSLSVATMILSMAFISGFKYEIREKLFSFWGHVHIIPYTPDASNIISPNPIKADKKLEQQVAATPHVISIAPFAVRPAIVNVNKYMEGVQLKGINNVYQLPQSIHFKGKWIDFADTSYSKDIVLSETTAARLDINAGDDILLYFLEPGATFPRIRKVKVSGLYHTGMDEVDHDFGICDIRLLQRINNWQADDINGYQLMLDDHKYGDSIAVEIFNKYLEAPLTTNTMQQIFPGVFDWLAFQDVNARIILIIMSIVAIINLAVALLILIVEQARMVGVLKAQGMQSGDIRKIFLYHAGLIAAVGILLGNIIALGICWLQASTGFLTLPEATYYVQQVPVRVIWWHPVLISMATLVLCILCMWLPSLYIRRIQPAKVLQFK